MCVAEEILCKGDLLVVEHAPRTSLFNTSDSIKGILQLLNKFRNKCHA